MFVLWSVVTSYAIIDVVHLTNTRTTANLRRDQDACQSRLPPDPQAPQARAAGSRLMSWGGQQNPTRTLHFQRTRRHAATLLMRGRKTNSNTRTCAIALAITDRVRHRFELLNNTLAVAKSHIRNAEAHLPKPAVSMCVDATSTFGCMEDRPCQGSTSPSSSGP